LSTARIRRFPLAFPLVLSALLAVLTAACGSDSPSTPSTSLRVTSIAPALGSTGGGTAVTITGSNFASDATVTIGGVPATSVLVQGTTGITAVTAPRTAGATDVVVTSGGRTATLAAAFTFVAPSSTNQPPVTTSIRSIGSRPNQPSAFADLDETITLVATVTDNETSAGNLTYTWSGPGTFSGAGPSITWRAPSSVGPTPSPVVVTLTVTETFVENGVTHTNLSTPAPFAVQVHDSQKEILDLGEDFLTLFSNSDVPVETVLRGFSTTCDRGDGRASEASDTANQRRKYRQDFSRFRITRLPPVTFNFGRTCVAFGDPGRVRPADACSLFTVHWEFTYLVSEGNFKPGDKGVQDGRDHVTAVLESNQWRLCHSDFNGAETNLRTGLTRQVQF
jgi:hypothetical protein